MVESGYDYTAYCQKPFALLDVLRSGADVGILVDVAFYPIAPISPLVDHVRQNGYYFCRNGNLVGHWASDRCLDRMGMTREDALTVEEISSYCVGLNFRDGRCIELLQRWCGFAADRLSFPGPHTNVAFRDPAKLDNGEDLRVEGRNPGLASVDSRVRGHRHDQTALSILAHRMGMRELTNRPIFTAYLGSEDGRTVLVNQGMGS